MGMFLICLVVIVVVILFALFAMKQNQDTLDDFTNDVTEDQLRELKTTPIDIISQHPKVWEQRVMIAKVKPQGSKVLVDALWFNRMLKNGELNQVTIAQFKMDKQDYKARNLKVGDFIKLRFNAQTGATPV